MKSIIDEKYTCFGFDASNWIEAIYAAGKLLEDNGDIEHSYTEAMVNMVNNLGPYIVVMPGIAMAHARANNNVINSRISMIKLKTPIEFGNKANDPVSVVFAIAGKNEEQHLQLFQSIANHLTTTQNAARLLSAQKYSDLDFSKSRIQELKEKMIVSCYADFSINPYMDDSNTMAHVAVSCLAGGAGAIRTNLEHVSKIRECITQPLIGIKKIYKGHDSLNSSFRITPTMKEVDELVAAGVDGVAIDGTIRERYDNLTFEQFVKQIKEKYPSLFIVADISTLEEGIVANDIGVDAVGTTLSGYTPYSKNPIVFGTLPLPEPDYELIKQLREAGVKRVIAEGRISTGERMAKAFEAGAFAVVIGTSITEPKKIVKTLLLEADKYKERGN